jgi:hypothetical protein
VIKSFFYVMSCIPARDHAKLWSKRICKLGDINLVMPLPCSLLGHGSLSCPSLYSLSRPPMTKSFYHNLYHILAHVSTRFMGNRTCITRCMIPVMAADLAVPTAMTAVLRQIPCLSSCPNIKPFGQHVPLVQAHAPSTWIDHRTC